MRIARVVSRLNLGGPARQILASDPLLLARGHAVRVFTGAPEADEGDLVPRLVATGVEVARIAGLRRTGGALDNWRALRALRRELAAFEPDLVHTHASKAGLLGRQAAPRAAARVHTFHGHVLEGYFPRPIGICLRRLERRLAARTNRVIAVSRATRDDLVRLGVAERGAIEVCPPGIELDPFLALDDDARARARAALGLAADALVIGFVGRLAAVKRPDLAGRVLAELERRGRTAHLVVAGDGPERAALLAAAGPAGERVHLLGATDDPVQVHAAADVVLCTSRSEGLPVALIEAAAAARPVVSTNVGGIAELVEDGVTGSLVPAPDGPTQEQRAVERLADGVLRWADAGSERDGAGSRARDAAIAAHGARALADRLEGIYRRVLEGRVIASAHGEVESCAS